VIKDLEGSALPLNVWGRVKCGDWVQPPMTNDLINHAHIVKLQIKDTDTIMVVFCVGDHIDVQGE
jgi:hypothetical protein